MDRERLEQAWPVDEPSPGFAARAVQRALAEASSKQTVLRTSSGLTSKRRPLLARGFWPVASALGLALAATLFIWLGRSASEAGERTASERSEISLGARAVAVLEPNASITWRGVRVTQSVGDVFYRVEHGSQPFSIVTPAGQIDVLGTCFRVQLRPQAAVAMVTVYEGKVRLTHAEHSLELRAGESGKLDAEGVHAVDERQAWALARPGARGGSGASGAQTADVASLRSKVAELERERLDLEQQLRTLENGLAEVSETAPSNGRQKNGLEPHDFDLDQADWKALAAQGRVHYLVPCMSPKGQTWVPDERALSALSLSPEDGQLLAEAYRRSNERLWATVRPLCVKAIGNEAIVDLLGGTTCMQIVQSTARADDPQAADDAFRRVAEVRAGLQPAPDPAKPQHPVFEGLWAMTGEMARFEADLIDSFGPDEAKRLAWHGGCMNVQTLGVGPAPDPR
jgi:ferric-dicitrate binding protein FerR (iron transport regulator)